MAQVPDSSDEELGVPTGAADSQQVPQNPFSPTGSAAVSPASQDGLLQMMNRVSEMVAASTQAATAAALAAQAVQQSVQSPASSPEHGLSATHGFADANKILTRPSSHGSASHEHDLTAWVDWAHAFKCWLVFAESAFEAELEGLESNLSNPVKIESLPEHTAERSRLFLLLLLPVAPPSTCCTLPAVKTLARCTVLVGGSQRQATSDCLLLISWLLNLTRIRRSLICSSASPVLRQGRLNQPKSLLSNFEVGCASQRGP